ncbi:MAG TPA: choice-of-anchor D domain-containing protein [Candidatus Acidoferrales bacterium]|jgi:hypothetical protein|nr:choice-of-anchor D domain-containing protein [Candidatus Acidoferrales bacterium]
MKMRVSSSSVGVFVHAFFAVVLGAFLFFPHLQSAAQEKAAGGHDSKVSSGKALENDSKARAVNAYKHLPLAFEKNLGQTDSQVQYLTHGSGYELFLTPQEAVLALWQPENSAVAQSKFISAAQLSRKASALRLELEGANPTVAMQGLEQLERKTNYFRGNDPKNWLTNVPSYERVEYRSIYTGIDLAFYGNQHRLEYDYVVSPGADPQKIAFRLKGSDKIRMDARGNLVVTIPSGDVTLEKPLVYQMKNGERRDVDGGYVLGKDGQVQFALSEYDHTQSLVIDPVLDYSTYLGGTASGDLAFGVAVDALGNAFVTGATYNATFPLSTSPATTVGLGTPDAALATSGGVFVSEINPTGTSELYFSYLSGDGGDTAYSIAVDPVVNTTCMNGATPAVCVYVTGQTFSDNFPVASVVTPYNAMAPTGGAPTSGNAFITKLDPYVSGASSLVYSSYLASTNGGDLGHGIAVDSTQDAYITGIALATPGAPPAFPILNGAQTTLPGASGNAFLSVLNTTASSGALLYSTYLGGDDVNAGTSTLGVGDVGTAVTVDASKIAYIVGVTPSSNFPNLNSTGTFPNIKGWQAANGTNTAGEAFVAAINTTLTGVNSLIYSTYVGGSTAELGYGIALGTGGIVYATGQTKSADFVLTETGGTAGKFPSPTNVLGVPFVTQLNTTAGGAPAYSVLIGGSNGDTGNGIQVDTLGNVIVAGLSQSTDFPVTPGAIKPALTGAMNGAGFIAKLNPTITGSAGLLYGSYFGGGGMPSLPDAINGVALDTAGNAFVAGQTYSTDFPVSAGAFENALPGGALSAAFVSKLTLLPVLAFGSPCATDFTATSPASCILTFSSTQPEGVTSAPQTFVVTNNTGSNITFTALSTSGTNSTDFTGTGTAVGATPACGTTLAATASCGFGVTFTPTTTGGESAILTVPYSFAYGAGTTSASQTVELTGGGVAAHAIVVLNPLTTLNFATPQPVGTMSSALPVTVTNTGNINLTFSANPATGSTEFVVASGTTCTTTTPVAPNGTCTINITFTPSAAGARSATLTLADNGTGSPQTLSLTGTGVASAPVVTLTPSTPISFSGLLVTTTSAAQTVTVKNTGSSNLNITATPAITGTNASDFAVATGTTCTSGAAVAANATCVINITFTPPAGASGARSATLSIADNATGSPQTLALSGTAWDFTISASSPTVSAGSSGTITVTVTGVGGFTGAVTLSCTSAIPQGGCSAPGTPVNASATGATGTVTVTTHSLVLPPASRKAPPVSTQQLGLFLLALLMLLTLPVAGRFRTRMGLAGAAALLVIVAGCSSALPTPKGAYNVVVTGTSGSVSHSATASVTVD